MRRKIRVLVGKPGLDGHDRGAKVVAAALRDAGMEVIYTGLHQTPEQIVEAAVQEDVDVVALSVLSGAHMTLFPEVMDRMRARSIGDKLLTGGGIIPAEDMATLSERGVGRLFGPGSSTQDIAIYIREWFQQATGDEPFVAPPTPLAPLPTNAALARPFAPTPVGRSTPVARKASVRKAVARRKQKVAVRKVVARAVKKRVVVKIARAKKKLAARKPAAKPSRKRAPKKAAKRRR